MAIHRPWPIDPISRAMLVTAGIHIGSLKPVPTAIYTTYFHRGATDMFWGDDPYDREYGNRRIAAPTTTRLPQMEAPTFEMTLVNQPDGPGWAYQRIMLAADVLYEAYGVDPPKIWLLGTVLPAAVACGLKGRPVAQVLDHPLIRGDHRPIHKALVNRGRARTVIYLPTKRT